MKVFLHILVLLVVVSCGAKKDKSEVVGDKPVVAVVNYPLSYFAKSIGGEDVEVYLPELSGDPAYWKPTEEHIVLYQNADLILTNGASYAKWLEKVSLPTSKIVSSLHGHEDQVLETDDGLVHSHGNEGMHSHKGTAITTWLDFKLAITQAKTVRDALINLIPAKKDEFKKRYEKLENDLITIDNKMTNLAGKIGHTELIVSHPIYQYLAKEYGLKLLSMHLEPDEAPSPEQWERLENLSKNHEIILWEDMPLDEVAQKLRELGITPLVFHACGNKPESGNFISVMEENINQLEDAFLKSQKN